MQPRVIPVPATAQSVAVDGASGRLVFYSWRETTGAAGAVFRLWDGSSNQGAMLLTFSLTAGESVREIPGMHTVPYEVGLFLEIVSGTVEGSVITTDMGDYGGGVGMPVFVVGSVDLSIGNLNEVG